MLLDPKAKMIFPFALFELGTIYFVFHVTLLLLRECADGIDLQSITKNYLFK